MTDVKVNCNKTNNECKKLIETIGFMYDDTIFPKKSDIIQKIHTNISNNIYMVPSETNKMVDFLKQLYKNNINNNIVVISACNSYVGTGSRIAKLGRTISINQRNDEITNVTKISPSAILSANINKKRDEIINMKLNELSKTDTSLIDKGDNYEIARRILLNSRTPIIYNGDSYEPSFFALSEEEIYNNKYLKYKAKYMKLKSKTFLKTF